MKLQIFMELKRNFFSLKKNVVTKLLFRGLILFLFIEPHVLKSQLQFIFPLTTKHELSRNAVTKIIQSKREFQPASIYNDYNFKVYLSQSAPHRFISKYSILTIVESIFYQTWVFKIASALGLIFIVFCAIQFRTRSIHKRNKELEHKVIERTKDLNKTIKDLNLEIASKDKFFSIIAHDLRSPFTALLGFAEHLVQELDYLSKEELKIIAESILKSTNLTFGLLENLLHWARIQTGRIEYNPVEINLKRILTKTVELYKANIESKNISFDINVDDNLNAFADLYMFETVLRNLISNSIKFTNRDGEITISVEDNEGYIKFKVADTGVGISQEKIDKLFKINENVSTIGTQNEKGSGLGLILCKEFIEYNRGKLSVKSKLGEGTEFTFILPKRNYYYLN